MFAAILIWQDNTSKNHYCKRIALSVALVVYDFDKVTVELGKEIQMWYDGCKQSK